MTAYTGSNCTCGECNDMSEKRKRIVCADCGRQIVSYRADNEYCVGPPDGSMSLGFGKIACPPCAKDERAWEVMMTSQDELP